MLIAHAPAGYIVSRLFNKFRKENISYIKYGALFSLWPDLDLLYFYLVDDKSTFHHFYFPHIPILFIICCCFIPLLKRLNVSKKNLNIFYLFLINWFVHLVLDTVTGGISWLYPLSEKILLLIEVPSNYSHWIISFVLHWSFLLEICIVLWAGTLFFKRRKASFKMLK